MLDDYVTCWSSGLPFKLKLAKKEGKITQQWVMEDQQIRLKTTRFPLFLGFDQGRVTVNKHTTSMLSIDSKGFYMHFIEYIIYTA